MPMSKNYWSIWVATLLFFAAFYTLMIPLPLYLTGVGLPDWQVGLVLGALGITSLLVRPIAGMLADGWGRRQVMLMGTASLIIGSVGVGFTTQPWLLFSLRILQATGYVAFTTAATALIADLATPEKRGSALAIFGVAANVAMTITPALVSTILDSLTLTGAFWLAGALAAVGGVLALRVDQPRLEPQQPESLPHSVWRDMLSLANRLRLPLIIAALFGLAFGTFFQFIPLLTERRELGSAGLVYTVYGISIIITRLFTGRLLDRVHQGLTLTMAFLMLAAGLGGFALAAAPVHLFIAAFLVAAGSGILHPLLIAIHVGQVSANERGRAGAVFYLGFDSGIGLGAWLLAPIFEWFGVTGLFLLAAAAAIAGIWPVWWMVSSPGQSRRSAPVIEAMQPSEAFSIK
ncbi:MAG: MFS transporter [Anaerolineae bacterium]|nr:MFS transporter [Anaerolineae bacterium]